MTEARPASIGSASMLADGTLVLELRADSGDGTVGRARYVLPPSNPHYGETLRHIGGLNPGETKAVPPWVDASRSV